MKDDLSFLAIDFETASPNQRASACAVGFAVVDAGTIVNAGKALINPDIPDGEWGAINTGIHGIHPADVRTAPKFFSACDSMLALASDLPLIAHNASFDMSVLRAEHERWGVAVPGYRYACSLQLARQVWPDLPSVSLPRVAWHLGIELDHHNPESDARACALITMAAIVRVGATSLDQALHSTGLWMGTVVSPNDWMPCGTGWLAFTADGATTRSSGERIAPNPAHPFFNKIVVFTGALGSMTRDLAEAHVRAIGGFTRPSVSKKTDFVVVGGLRDIPTEVAGHSLSTKHRRAIELRDAGAEITLLAEGDFLSLL